jgi:hypothetical protein
MPGGGTVLRCHVLVLIKGKIWVNVLMPGDQASCDILDLDETGLSDVFDRQLAIIPPTADHVDGRVLRINERVNQVRPPF